MNWDIQYLQNNASFKEHADMNNQKTMGIVQNWVGLSDMSKPFKGPFFGNWDAKAKAMTEGFKAQFDFMENQYGFFREHVNGKFGNPIIVVSERRVKPGKMCDMLTGFNAAADHFYENVPGMVAIINSVDKKDCNMAHDLQIFRDMEAFMQHANMSDPTTKQLLMNWSMHWEPGFTGHVMCDDVAAVKQMTDGFKANFEFHAWPASSGCINMGNGECNMDMDICYFPIHARCETQVLFMNYNKLPYTRSVITPPDWPNHKASKEFPGLPQVTWCGKEHGQNKAVIRSVALASGFYKPSDPMCAFACDVVLEDFDGVLGAMSAVAFAPPEKQQELG